MGGESGQQVIGLSHHVRKQLVYLGLVGTDPEGAAPLLAIRSYLATLRKQGRDLVLTFEASCPEPILSG